MLLLEYHPERKQPTLDSVLLNAEIVPDSIIVLSERQRAYFYFRMNQWTFHNQVTINYVFWSIMADMFPDINFKTNTYTPQWTPLKIILIKTPFDESKIPFKDIDEKTFKEINDAIDKHNKEMG